jgi:hypothetical protein
VIKVRKKIRIKANGSRKTFEAFYQTHGMHGKLDMRENLKQDENPCLNTYKQCRNTQPHDHQAQ